MLRHELVEGERDVVRLTNGQFQLLNQLRNVRRASIVGGAGTGKTMLAAEKARRLAREGFRTLLVCFNAPLARVLADELEETARDTGLLDVKTFHQLCEDLGHEADVLAARPDPIPQDWWDRTLPRALDDAVERSSGRGTTRSSSTRARTSTPSGWRRSTSCCSAAGTTSCTSSTTRPRRSTATTSSRSSG